MFYFMTRCAEILLKGITKQSLNELEENTLRYETPLLIAAENGHSEVSIWFTSYI